jgi:hypothetical protein
VKSKELIEGKQLALLGCFLLIDSACYESVSVLIIWHSGHMPASAMAKLHASMLDKLNFLLYAEGLFLYNGNSFCAPCFS